MFLRSTIALTLFLLVSCSGSEAPALSDKFLHGGLEASVMAGTVVEIGQRHGYSAIVKDPDSMALLTQDEPAFFVFLENGTQVAATISNVGVGERIDVMIFASGEPDGEKRAKLMAELKQGLSQVNEGET